ncbi:US12 family protein [Candidatus Pacearchaeota archaeon]|nr:US12 family protein [Candidatus Pacearchaeota archaeon]
MNTPKKVHEKTRHLKPIITEKKMWNMKYFLFALIIGIVIVASIVTILILFELSIVSAIAMVAIFIAFYSLFLFFLIEPQILREIQKERIITQIYEKPVMKQIIKEVVKEIEKPVIKEVIKEIHIPAKRQAPIIKTKTIMVERPRKKLNIPKYEFFGSTQTKTYHKASCRLRKLIKRKYKETGHTKVHFISRGYKPCKICLKADAKKTKTTKRVAKVKTPTKPKKRPISIKNRAAAIRAKRKKTQAGKLNKTLNKIEKLSKDTNKKVKRINKKISKK